jgi:hypothetical protein
MRLSCPILCVVLSCVAVRQFPFALWCQSQCTDPAVPDPWRMINSTSNCADSRALLCSLETSQPSLGIKTNGKKVKSRIGFDSRWPRKPEPMDRPPFIADHLKSKCIIQSSNPKSPSKQKENGGFSSERTPGAMFCSSCGAHNVLWCPKQSVPIPEEPVRMHF